MYSQDALVAEIHGKRRKRRAYFILILIFLVLYAAVLGTAWLILRSPIFRINRIDIAGNSAVSRDDVMNLLVAKIIDGNSLRALLGFNNILIWPENLTGSDLVFTPAIKELAIKKDFSARSVEVKVAERTPYGIWCIARNASSSDASESCWWFDGDGFIFKRAISAEGGLITTVHDYSQTSLGLNEEILPDNFIPNAFSVFNVLRASNLGIKEIRLNDLSLEELEVDIYDGPKLYFSLRFPAGNLLQVIQSFYIKPGFDKLQYLDFRVQNRVYYK
jgi:hypothetical protein